MLNDAYAKQNIMDVQFHGFMANHYEKSCSQKPHYPITKVQNHLNTIVLQLRFPKGNSYATTHYKYGDLINKISRQKISWLFDSCIVILKVFRIW
jgi:hypothetical protein